MGALARCVAMATATLKRVLKLLRLFQSCQKLTLTSNQASICMAACSNFSRDWRCDRVCRLQWTCFLRVPSRVSFLCTRLRVVLMLAFSEFILHLVRIQVYVLYYST